MRQLAPVEELPNRRRDHAHAAFRGQPLHHLLKRRVGLALQCLQDEGLMRIEHRALGLALLGRPDVALRAFQPTPGPRRRFPDRKAGRRLTRRHAAFERRHNTLAQIQAVRLTHRSIPPAIAVRIESLFPAPGNPSRLSFQGKCSSALGRAPVPDTGAVQGMEPEPWAQRRADYVHQLRRPDGDAAGRDHSRVGAAEEDQGGGIEPSGRRRGRLAAGGLIRGSSASHS